MAIEALSQGTGSNDILDGGASDGCRVDVAGGIMTGVAGIGGAFTPGKQVMKRLDFGPVGKGTVAGIAWPEI